MANNVLVGVSKSKLQIKCPKCGHNTLVDFLEFYIATLEISPFECAHCQSRFNINVELLDPPARTPDTADSGQTCPRCAGKGDYKVGIYHETCDVCAGSGHV